MNRIFSILVAASVLAMPLALSSEASAAPYHHDNHNARKHDSWVRGHRISDTDRRRAVSVDYRLYHLSAPAHGYRWVRIDNSFLLIGDTSGLISNVQIAR
jgi:Ni/Co efflux regulator RcnB